MKKILCFGLVLVLLLSSLAACGGTTPKPGPETTGSEGGGNTEPVTEAPEGFPLVKNGTAAVLRYSVFAEGADFKLAADSTNKLSRALKVTVERKDDGKLDPDAYEILLGNTDYTESKTTKGDLSYGEGIIKVVGNKLVLVATGTEQLDATITALIANLSQFRRENGDYVVPNGFLMVVNSNETIKGLPVLAGREPVVYAEGDESFLLCFPESQESDYTTYIDTFKAKGYRQTAANDLEGNLFATLTNGEKIVNLAWTPKTKDLRVSVDLTSIVSLPNSESENVYDKTRNVTPTITQIGLWYGDQLVTGTGSDAGVSCADRQYASEYFAGMAYVIQLTDGSFIVVDGGYDTDYHITNLYNVLKKQAPDPDHIVIAAWIFSHAHGDHVGVVPGFLTRYAGIVTVEKFIFNFPTNTRGTDDGGGGANESRVRAVLKNNAYKNAKIIKAHAGQVDYVRNAKVNVLYTLEMQEPFKLSYYNDCSLIFTLEIGGQKMFFLGDCGDGEDRNFRVIYGTETFKSDILQVSHHAINGSGGVTYSNLIRPEWALVPAAMWNVAVQQPTRVVYCNDKERKHNAYVAAMPEDRVFLAGKGITMLTISGGTVSQARYWATIPEYLG